MCVEMYTNHFYKLHHMWPTPKLPHLPPSCRLTAEISFTWFWTSHKWDHPMGGGCFCFLFLVFSFTAQDVTQETYGIEHTRQAFHGGLASPAWCVVSLTGHQDCQNHPGYYHWVSLLLQVWCLLHITHWVSTVVTGSSFLLLLGEHHM